MDDVRRRILDAALAAFGGGRFGDVSVNELRSVAGVSNGSFFHHFPSREHVVAELLLESLAEYHRALEGAVTPGRSAADGVGALVEAHLRWVSSSPARAQVMFVHPEPAVAAMSTDRRDDENRRFRESLAAWRDPLVATGALVDVPMGVFIAQVIGPAQIACRAWLSGRTTVDPVESASDLVVFARRALVTQEHP